MISSEEQKVEQQIISDPPQEKDTPMKDPEPIGDSQEQPETSASHKASHDGETLIVRRREEVCKLMDAARIMSGQKTSD